MANDVIGFGDLYGFLEEGGDETSLSRGSRFLIPYESKDFLVGYMTSSSYWTVAMELLCICRLFRNGPLKF